MKFGERAWPNPDSEFGFGVWRKKQAKSCSAGSEFGETTLFSFFFSYTLFFYYFSSFLSFFFNSFFSFFFFFSMFFFFFFSFFFSSFSSFFYFFSILLIFLHFFFFFLLFLFFGVWRKEPILLPTPNLPNQGSARSFLRTQNLPNQALALSFLQTCQGWEFRERKWPFSELRTCQTRAGPSLFSELQTCQSSEKGIGLSPNSKPAGPFSEQ